MGGSIATSYSGKDESRQPHARTMVELIMPLYYTKDQITSEEVAILKEVWTLIEGNQSQFFSEFQQKLRLAGVKTNLWKDWFDEDESALYLDDDLTD